jgi:hypothetical protein
MEMTMIRIEYYTTHTLELRMLTDGRYMYAMFVCYSCYHSIIPKLEMRLGREGAEPAMIIAGGKGGKASARNQRESR